ncbi:uncharacterized protein LOC130552890 isoform X2 [Triplophysa rosa]|uniref:Uncharacterized protein n=2 Tax=Triplophysa rosa TaxID=992332 RepID=A0A9W7WZC9_TRIRA|nr:uncharacterized protein LOC130552890 isoform X2 [Triplophysa rosa]XP_057187546.1 uncharacterized protein LOC130552890 isoform X2 [Triplophysa rosa]KAI7810856.1 hypothetical protein IRJ41_007352 [Triplophysa rosa]
MMRSVGTQLSVGTLRNVHVRSKGIQATVSSQDVGTETVLMLPDMRLSSTPVRGSMFRPSKRPRLELEEEHEEERDSTYIPESVTQESELSIDPESNYGDKKYIVFESCLRQVFESCPVCKATCDVRKRQMGTFVAFTQLCEKCQYHRRWQSQPIVGSTPVGNLQLCAATYFLGGSYAKLQKIFKAMQLQTVQYSTFRRHARNFLEPTIIHKWNRDQEHLIQQLQERGKLAIAGDMRADSPAHSGKYGSYTLMDMETKSIVDLQLIQSNEVGGSYHMEKEGLKRCLDKMESCGLMVDYIVTDRHPQIKKYLRERNVTQYYDVWHFEKALSKKLHKLSQSKDCKVLKKWLKSIKNHLNWSATSSVSGPEKVAKWTSLLNHIQNIHVHDNPLFPKCEHPDRVSRDPKKWFQPVALHKVEKVTCNKRVLKDFEKLSHHFQTSSLKAFHRRIRRFAPKNVVFYFIGMLCRLYLAAMHYNENCSRPQATTTQGQATYKIGFPKSKQGKCTAKPVKTDPTYNCVDDLMSLLLRKVIVDSTPYAEELHQITVPPPLSSQFEKPSKEDVT